jgi:hypothetical protein
MKTETLDIIKNFGAINQNLVFREGNVLRTVADAKNIVAKATLEDEFPFDFGIYDVSELISAFALLKDADVSYFDNYLEITSGSSSIKYFYSDIEMLTAPPEKELVLPSKEVKFHLSHENLSQLKKAASALGAKKLSISSGDNGLIELTISDPTNATSNCFTLEVEGASEMPDDSDPLKINIDNLKIVSGDYDVAVSSKLISEFTNTQIPLTYWVALEKN